MKKLILLLLGVLFVQLAIAQMYVDGVLIDNDKAEHYLLAEATEKKKQIGFMIQCAGFKGTQKLTDAQGEPLLFDTLAAGFNFFYQQGWEFSSVISDVNGVSDGPVRTYSTFLFQRRK